ncbi:tripartite tricarboxylate transporter substrate binding protein [soil metagenome]
MADLRRRAICTAAAAAFGTRSQFAIAQTFPNRPMKWIVGFSAGSSTDTVARLVAQKLGDAMGQPVVIDNRPGVGGNLAADVVSKSPADGYTLLFCNNGLAISASLYAKLSFDPVHDLLPVTQVTSMPHVMLANNDLPARSVKELIELAKAHPGKYNFASAGAGNSDHMSGALFNVMAGTDIVHVPYRGGPQAMTDTIAGNTALYFSGLPGALPMIKSGKVKALGVSSLKESAALPGVPPIADTVPGYEVNLWYALMAPAGTPQPIVSLLAAEIAKVLAHPDTLQQLRALGVDPSGSTPAAFATFYRAEIDKWAKVVKSTGITVN